MSRTVVLLPLLSAGATWPWRIYSFFTETFSVTLRVSHSLICLTFLTWRDVGPSGIPEVVLPHIGFSTGTGKPVVFPKRVPRVRVWCWVLVHRDTPRTRTRTSTRYRGYRRVNYSGVSVIFAVLILVFSDLFSLFFHFVIL